MSSLSLARRPNQFVPLYPKQVEFLSASERFVAFAAGIGSGKSFVLCYNRVRTVQPGLLYMVLAPTYPMLRDATLRSFLDVCERVGAPVAFNRSENRLTFLRSRAEVLFRSADNPESLRGPNLAGVDIDEASLVPREVFDIAIGRLRQGSEVGTLRAAFTPKGPTHWTHEIFNTGRPDTRLIRARTDENPFLPAAFYETVKQQYGDTPFAQQELEGAFVQPEGAVFPAEWLNWPGFMVDAVPDGITRTLLYLDPSQGKDAQVGDAQAFVLAHFWPGPRKENLIYLECVAVKEDPIAMVARGVRLCRDRNLTHWDYEVNGTMGLLDAEVRRQLTEAGLAQTRIYPVTNTEKKQHRIRNTFTPYLQRKAIRVVDTPGGHLLRAQLCDCPFATHDDCSDAGAGAIMGIERVLRYGA